MMEEVSEEDYISQARHLIANDCYSKAFDFYIMSFDESPETKTLHESEFRDVLTKYNEILFDIGKIEDIFNNFGLALKAFPDNVYMLNDVGKYLYKFGYYAEAWSHFQKALKIDSTLVSAEKNLNSVKNLLVERWHFRMLNDKIRNESYREAIRQTLVPVKDSILDLGTGTGLLAIYASERYPMVITACDSSEVMSQLADTITEDNGIDQIIVLNKMSTSLDYKDIGGKKTLLLTEMFDAGLLGEHILQSLSHAWEELIDLKRGRVIPNKAEFFVIGAYSDHLARKYQLSDEAKSLLNIPQKIVHILTFDESYDSDDVDLYQDLKYMTEKKSLFSIDFNNYNDIQDKLKRTEPYHVTFKVKEDGVINIVIGWFKLYLSKTVDITTDPTSTKKANAWQQAIFYDNLPRRVAQKQTISYDFLINGGKITMLNSDATEITRVSTRVIRFLNDAEYMKLIKACIGVSCVQLCQLIDLSEVNIVDFCPFPIFGLFMMKRGAQSLVCCAKTVYDKNFLKMVFSENNVPLPKIKILMGDNVTQNHFEEEMYHAIFSHIFELSGDIDPHLISIAEQLRQTHLVEGGLFLPANYSLVTQAVHSTWIDINNCVNDSNVSNYNIAEHVNKYQVSQNFCIDLSLLEYTPLTEPYSLCSNHNGERRSHTTFIPSCRTGVCNAILCWYNIELLEGLGTISTKRNKCFMDGTVFIVNPGVQFVQGGIINLLRYIDADGSFKLNIGVDAMLD